MQRRSLARPETLVAAAFAALAVALVVRDQGGYFAPSWGWSTLAFLGLVATWLVASGRTDAGRYDVAFLAALLALTAWVALSIAWSVDRAQSVLELERGLVPLAGCGALLAFARRRGLSTLVPALVAAITAICGYSLSTRLAPAAGAFRPRDPVAGYRLFEPVGYWNGLGVFAVLGILLALGLATDPNGALTSRLLGAAALVPLPVTLFFTFSRGAWVALAFGLLVAVATSPRRLRFTVEAAIFALAPAGAVVLADRAGPLTHENATLAAATHAGHRLAVALLLLAVAAAVVVPLVRRLERRLRVSASVQRRCAFALVAAAVLALGLGLVHGGGPVAQADRAYDSFVDPLPPPPTNDLTTRLVSLNGNGRAQLWSVAVGSLHGRWAIGRGAGSFERTWEQSPKANEVVRDAHGLYVETLSELGAVGLALLVIVLAIPLVAGLRRRAAPLVPAIAAAYGAFLLHLGVDWDWELSGVALTGLFVGCLLLVARRDDAERSVPARLRAAGTAAAVAAAAFAFVGLAGNNALADAQAANRTHRYAKAATAASVARRWMPWSPAPLKALGEARLERGDTAGARASFLAAVSVDPNDWQSWLDLAATVGGDARRRAVERARRLYPTSPEISEFVQRAGVGGGDAAAVAGVNP